MTDPVLTFRAKADSLGAQERPIWACLACMSPTVEA
jgi:hypothetical protein